MLVFLNLMMNECDYLLAIFDVINYCVFCLKMREFVQKQPKDQTNKNTTHITREIIRNDDVIIWNNISGSAGGVLGVKYLGTN